MPVRAILIAAIVTLGLGWSPLAAPVKAMVTLSPPASVKLTFFLLSPVPIPLSNKRCSSGSISRTLRKAEAICKSLLWLFA